MGDDDKKPVMFDDGMKPDMRAALFRLQQDLDREAAKRQRDADKEAARAAALAGRAAAPEGHLYLDEAVAQLVSRLQSDPDAAGDVRADVESAIRMGELHATSARKKLPIRPGTKFDPDDCLLTMPALFAWAGVNEAQVLDTPASLDAIAATGAPTPAPGLALAPTAPVSAKRANALTSVIERACLEVPWPWRTADVWLKLWEWAELENPPSPLVEPKGGVIIYMEFEDNSELTREQLAKRLSRMRGRRRASR